MEITPYDLAHRFLGIKEFEGENANHQVMAMLKLDSLWPTDDSVPWCSAFVNYIAWLLGIPRTKSLRARSWLRMGSIVSESRDARVGFDIVILGRGECFPGPHIIDAPGHVGFYSKHDAEIMKSAGPSEFAGLGYNK